MSDELVLFLILCLIYAADALMWVGRDSVAFVTWGGAEWKDKAVSRLFQTSEGGLLLLNPFPPLGKVVCCHLPPLSVSHKGICSLNCQILAHAGVPEHDIVVFFFKEISSIRTKGADLFVNAEQFCRFQNVQQAEKISRLLNSLLNTAEADRKIIIQQFWNEQFNIKDIKTKFEQGFHQMIYLKVLCNILFIYLFTMLLIFLLYLHIIEMLIPVAFLAFIIAVQISVIFYSLHRRIYPDASEDRISNLIKMILCPPSSIRACDLITENLPGNYNPLAVAHLLLSRERFRKFAVQTLRNLKYPPVDYFKDRPARRIIMWQNDMLLKTASGCLRAAGYIRKELLSPPVPNDAGVRFYCPRCLCQFTKAQGSCPDCPGVKLLELH